MTELRIRQNEKLMCVRICLEVGHECEPRRSPTGRALALDWRVWVRGVGGRDISPFVHKVVFHLHPPSAFVYPKRVLQEPPYEIQETGCASIEIPIHVYLKCIGKPKKIRLRYRLQMENNSLTSSECKYVYYDFENPPKQLCDALMEGGGEIIPRKGCRKGHNEELLLLFSDRDGGFKSGKGRQYKYVKPVQGTALTKASAKSYVIEEICSKCGDLEFRRQLRSVDMTDEEIGHVSKLYLAYSSYEKSVDALILPPISDPIYTLPDLPPSLKGALSSIEMDYTMQ